MNEIEEILGITFPKGIKISHATNSSKKVKKDSIFFGLQGTREHGSKYIEDALDSGASIAVHNDPDFLSKKNNVFFIKDLEEIDFYDFLLLLYYKETDWGKDARKYLIYISGITGTNGKSTTAALCQQIWLDKWLYGDNKPRIPKQSMYIGTLGVKYNHSDFITDFSKNTTPDIFELFEIITHFVTRPEGLRVFIEVSSHALDQNRLKNTPFCNAAILNIEDDHMDYHKNVESYVDSKFKIARQLRSDKVPFHINSTTYLNIDSPRVFKKLRDLNKANSLLNIKENYGFSLVKKLEHSILSTVQIPPGHPVAKKDHALLAYDSKADDSSPLRGRDYRYSILNLDINQTEFEIASFRSSVIIRTNIFQEFNISNLIFAFLLTREELLVGLDHQDWAWDEVIYQYESDADYRQLKLPKGRSELIKDIPANVIIDYAHNPGAFNTFLLSTKEYFDNLVIIFGCGGNRDQSKRSEMLKIAIENGKNVIFTSDNSRNESFQSILSDAQQGNSIKNVKVIEDRKEAIIYGSKLIEEKDCLVILGKGHEETQEMDGKIIHFSDHEVVNEIYK